ITTDAEQRQHRFPVILISFTLIWFGVLTPIGNYWLTNQAVSFGSIAQHNALFSLLCGGALLTARCQPRISRLLAILTLIASLLVAQELFAGLGHGWLSSLDLSPSNIKRKDIVLPALLSVAIFCCSLGTRGR